MPPLSQRIHAKGKDRVEIKDDTMEYFIINNDGSIIRLYRNNDLNSIRYYNFIESICKIFKTRESAKKHRDSFNIKLSGV